MIKSVFKSLEEIPLKFSTFVTAKFPRIGDSRKYIVMGFLQYNLACSA